MKTLRIVIIIPLVLLVATVCVTPGRISQTESKRFERYLARLAQEYIELKPHLVASTGRLDHLGIDTPQPTLPSFADRKRLREFRWVERNRKTLRSFRPAALSPQQRVYRKIIDYWFSDVLAGERFYYHDYIIDHFFGIQVVVPEFFAILPVTSPQEARHYLALLAEVPGAVEDWLEACRVREQMGLVPPTIIMKQVMDQIRCLLFTPVEEDLMFASFSQALEGVGRLSAAQKAAFRSEAKRLIAERVNPAFSSALEYLSELKQTGTSIDAGVLELPDGEAYYQYLLNHYTTLELTPAEIHQLGLAEMQRLEEQIAGLLAAEGREADIPAALANIGGEVFSGREAIFAKYGNIIAGMEKTLPSLFITLPHKGLVLEKTPAFKEKVAGNFYYMGSLDDSRPGRFIMNLSYSHPEFFMHHLAYHETIPGHHLQLARATENPAVPLVLKLLLFDESQFLGFIEGWALYAESLAWENGFYDRTETRLGYLSAMLTRAARLVVDTGLHARGWSVRDAERFYSEHFGAPRTREVFRYMVIPGQGCAYFTGYLRILGLREARRERLGDDFDIRRFHESLLACGAVPLALLEEIAAGAGPPTCCSGGGSASLPK